MHQIEENFSVLAHDDECRAFNANSNEPEHAYAFTFYDIKHSLNRLLGQVLTQIDSSITDPIQRKAMKDRIKNDFRSQLDGFTDYPFYKQALNKYIEWMNSETINQSIPSDTLEPTK